MKNPFRRLELKNPYRLSLLILVLCEAFLVILIESLVFDAVSPSGSSSSSSSASNNTASISSNVTATISSNSSSSSGGGGSSNTRNLPIYLIIFILSQVFQILLVLDALIAKNTIEIIGFVCFNFCCALYSVVQIYQLNDIWSRFIETYKNYPDLIHRKEGIFSSLRIYLIILSVVISLFEIVYIWLALKLYHQFRWSIYKYTGADIAVQRIYRSYHIFLLFVKLDVFFFLGFALQFLLLVLREQDLEMGLTIFAIPITMIILYMGYYAVKNEKEIHMRVFLVTLVLALIYFIFKITRIYTDPKRKTEYEKIRIFLTTFAALSVVVTVMTLIYGYMCWRNFGKGLKKHLTRTRTIKQQNYGLGDGDWAEEDDDDDADAQVLRVTTTAKATEMRKEGVV